MKQILFVYRNNDLFNQIIPEVTSHFSKDINVDYLIFPQGTSMEDIIHQREEKLKTISCSTLFVSDNTCKITKKTEGYTVAINNGLMRLEKTLDELLEREIWKIFETKSYEDIFKKIAKLITTNPNEIILIEDGLKDHISDIKVWENPTGIMTFCLKEIYPNAHIQTVLKPEQALKHANDENILIIADRHTQILDECWKIEEWKHKAKLYLLPFENATRHLGIKAELSEGIKTEDIASEIIEYYEQI
jgi:hypothetical protein